MKNKVSLLLFIGGLVGGFFFFFSLLDALAPFISGFILAYLFRPLVEKLHKISIPATISSAFLTVLMYCALITLFILLLPYCKDFIVSSTSRLLFHKKELIALVEPWVKKFPLAEKNWPDLLNSFDFVLDNSLSWLKDWALSAVYNSWWIAKHIITLFLAPFIAFYMMKDWKKMILNICVLVPYRFRTLFYEVFSQIDTTLSAYVRGQASVSTMLAFYYGITLWALGLHSGALVGMLTGLFTFVPYLGILSGFLTSVILACLQNPKPSFPLLISIFGAGHLLEGMFLTPGLIGRKIGLHPALILLSVFIAGSIGGIKGVFLSCPLTAIAVACFRWGRKYYINSPFFLEKS
ncbi:MAG: hypothetical protein BGO07_02570 [Alphaproteobacteria bacterium 40-19]|nr:MAG: hypothetical protein BGO07_02570 [Alphaproteobacteria bacterium 40-19]